MLNVLESSGPLFTALGAVLVALIAILAKRTPERKDATEVVEGSITLLASRVDALEQSNQTLWNDVEKLRERVSKLWRALEIAKSYIRSLESMMADINGTRPERPEEVDALMKE